MRQFDAKVVTMTQAEFDGLGGRYQPDTTYIVDGAVKKIGDADLSTGTGSGSVAVQSIAELNSSHPPASSTEGSTALVGPMGSRVEYILLNGAWQVRAVVVIGGAA